MRLALMILTLIATANCSASDAFDNESLRFIESSKKIKTFQLNGSATDETHADDAIAGYKVVAKGEKLGKDIARKVSALLARENGFKLVSDLKDFNPSFGMRVINGDDSAELAISGSALRIKMGGGVTCATFGVAVRDEFQELVRSAFPKDPALTLSPAEPDAPAAKPSSEAMRTFFGEPTLTQLAGASSIEACRVKLEQTATSPHELKATPSPDSPDSKTAKIVTHGTRISDKYSIVQVGKPLDKETTAKWIAALSDESGYHLDKAAPDFGPEVAFKFRNGDQQVCVEISFLSNRLRIGKQFSSGRPVRIKPELRTVLFKLVKEAFPDEKDIQRLPATWAWGVQVLEPSDSDAHSADPGDL
jgi:hypothetical protein